jgi:DNA repair protein RadA/Sms
VENRKLMTKHKDVYYCQSCETEYPKWAGQCTHCGRWNTLNKRPAIENNTPAASAFRGYAGAAHAAVTALAAVPLSEQARISTNVQEFDRVLGGGLVAGAAILLGGDPGIGKSTLLLQILAKLAGQHQVLYVTGEESLQQVSLRAHRLQLQQTDMLLLAETCVETILSHAIKQKPNVLVIDSIQTSYSEQTSSAPGSVSQVRESAARLVHYAKQTNTVLILVGHVTKEGNLAGPRVLEHMVDTVLYFENRQDSRFRIIRAVKNRFGAVNELGVFVMTEMGLREVNNPSAIFLSQYQSKVSGSTVLVTWEGSRPLLVEMQALVDESHLGNPRRVTVGFDQNRLAMLLAVLHRHGGVATYNQDVFVNVVGGMKITETASDLALVMAVLSSLRNQVFPQDWVIFGEVGLAGEIRPVPYGQERLKEAAKLGFKQALMPTGNVPKHPPAGIALVAVDHIAQALVAIQAQVA